MDEKKEILFNQFMATQNVQVGILGFVLNLLLTALLAYLIAVLYRRYGTSLSNRYKFSKNFVLLATITMIIITIVKSSLALSLGLVGALSIVRFRSAIKEPEELVFLFLCIAIGLGFGASQTLVTIVSFVVLVCIIIGTNFISKKEHLQNLILTINNPIQAVSTSNIISVLGKHCSTASLKRIDSSEDHFEASFVITVVDVEKLNELEKELKDSLPALRYTFLDTEGAL